jgi:hypothetical protein
MDRNQRICLRGVLCGKPVIRKKRTVNSNPHSRKFIGKTIPEHMVYRLKASR